jgi:hypothetical protein
MPAELFLQFVDDKGAQKSVAVEDSPFVIGRTPENDLQIPNGSLSRKHAQIERFADVFILSDCGSSNGTQLNGVNLDKPVAVKNGDKILLGGAVEIAVEIVSDEAGNAADSGGNAAENFSSSNDASQAVAASESSAVWTNLFIIAPICGIVLLLFGGILFFALSGKTEPKIIAQRNREIDDELIENRRETNRKTANEDQEPEETPTPRKTANENASNSANSAPSNSGESNSGNNQISSEQETIEKNALQFLRSISSDANPVLTGKQLNLINAKIKSLKNSAALRENLRAAKRGATNFQATAKAHNLKPLFVTAAALAKLNETRGEPTVTANQLAPSLGKFGNVLGTELANDCLLVIVANEEGGGDLALRDRLANLAKQSQTSSAATIRTIWFLHDNGKISESAFDFAVRFLAIGTISQNPKDFGIDAEALSF